MQQQPEPTTLGTRLNQIADVLDILVRDTRRLHDEYIGHPKASAIEAIIERLRETQQEAVHLTHEHGE
jgi:low affinity Fe/Cu permease